MHDAHAHATAVLLDDRGILVKGRSGSGKSTLALHLLHRFSAQSHFCRLIADDQVLLFTHHGRLIVRAPEPISGLVEVHGLGPRAIEFVGQAVIDLVVNLVPAPDAPRFQEDRVEMIGGCGVAVVELPERSAHASGEAVAAWLRCRPFH